MDINYHVVDVFTDTALQGNSLAVFPDARCLDEALMQKIARELNLVETTFVVPSTDQRCVARVRIFTPACEMFFAGHPTIGTAYVLRELGIVSREIDTFTFEEKIGPVDVRIDPGESPMIWLKTPQIAKRAVHDRARCAKMLGLHEDDLLDIPPQVLSSGNPILYVALHDKTVVDRVAIDSAVLHALPQEVDGTLCVFAFAPTAQGAYSRMFVEFGNVIEDPATGSATGPLAAFMMEHGLVSHADGTRFMSEQGTKWGRRSLLHVFIRGEYGVEGIEVGGQVVPIARATMTLSSIQESG